MYYLHHVHPASASSQSVYLANFLPSGPCLCRVLHTSLSFVALPDPHASSSSTSASSSSTSIKPLTEALSLPLNARILRVAVIPASSESGGRDRLAVLTDHHQPRLIILNYRDDAIHRADLTDEPSVKVDWTPIDTESVLQLDELGRAAAEGGLNLEVEQGVGASYLFSHTHTGRLKVASLSATGSREIVDGEGDQVIEGSGKTDKIDLSTSFGVQLPHPHLISSTFLARRSPTSLSTIALLSLSSTASRLPGLGMQCLPVLSFHSIDESVQELKAMPWGPPRRVPPLPATPKSPSSAAVTSPASPKQGRRKSSNSSTAPAPTRPNAPKYNGPAAMGATRTAEEEEVIEEERAKTPLARAHVPIPFSDALGAHLLLSLPARAGGGVLLFCESCILHVAPPNGEDYSVRSPLSPRASAAAAASGKRRKASVSQTALQSPTMPRRTSGANAPGTALSTSPVSPILTTSVPPVRSNENGKRRRSTASSQTQAPSIGEVQSTSPTSSRRRSTTTSKLSLMTRILRLDLMKAVIVASALVVTEPGAVEDDGVQIDEHDQMKASVQVLFGTHSGLLHLLTISLEKLDETEGEPWRPRNMQVAVVGPIPAPTSQGALLYLGESFVSVASAGGDSVIAQILSEPDTPSTSRPPYTLKIVHRWTNLAPILDFAVDDGAGGDPSHARSAQARIITCSGTGPSGSLRVIRNGVSLEDALSIPEGQVRRIWSISSADQHTAETRLVILGYHTHNRVLSFASQTGTFEDLTGAMIQAGWNASIAILGAQSLPNGKFILVDQGGVSVWSVDGLQLLSSWKPANLAATRLQQATISQAASNAHGQVLIALKTFVALLHVDVASGRIELLRLEDMESEVSALSITSLQENKASEFAAIALWRPWVVKLIMLSDWQDVTPSVLTTPQPSLIRSVVLHTFTSAGVPTSEPHLLLGLGDGTLNSYGLSLPTSDSLSKKIGLLEKRSASMGSQPLHLSSFQTAEGLRAIFVCCDRPSVVFSYGKGLQYSSVRHREVRDVCQFIVEDEVMMVLAKKEELVVSRMGQIQKLDVGTVELGNDNPVSLTMCAEARIVAVVANTFLPEGRQTAAIEGGKVILFDHESFERLDEYRLELEERPNCIESITMFECNILVVGTGYQFPDRSETLSGRILLFTVSKKTRKLHLLSSLNVEGNTYAVGRVGRYIAACVNAKVITFEVEQEAAMDEGREDGKEIAVELMQVSEWACAFTAITLRTVGTSKLVIGDALRSIVLLKVDTSTGKIDELARDCDPYWTMAAEVLDEEEEVYLGCDIGFNLWTCTRLKWTENAKKQMQKSRTRNLETGMGDSGEAEDPVWSHIMQRDAAFHYGDLINSMRRGALTANSGTSSSVESRIVFGSAAGAIGVIAKVDERVGKVLSQLELNLRETFEPVGRIPADEWRTLRTDHRTQKSAGFIDGDFLNGSYQNMSAITRTQMLTHGPFNIEAEPDEVNSLIESLNRLS
ncbi:hypothetical protein CBS101457_006045 [Exobasidium rhododendri]|nr:hypothetical protein CBS101457_006045 [Exobasidium rhododendri]